MTPELLTSKSPSFRKALLEEVKKKQHFDDDNFVIEYGNKKFKLSLPLEALYTIGSSVEQNQLGNLILNGLRIEEKNGFKNQKNKPTIGLFLGYENNKTIGEKTETLQSDEERITQKIQDLIVCTEGTGNSSQLCLGNWMTITLPPDLNPDRTDDDPFSKSDPELIAKLVVNGFRMTEIE